MLALLDVRPGDRVLDVGSGSGWTTALLAHLTGPSGRVYGVELVPDLTEFGQRNLAAFFAERSGVTERDPAGDQVAPEDDSGPTTHSRWATVSLAETGVLGLPSQAPYDRILVSAEARKLPEELTDQLGAGGRLVIPVAGRLTVVDRDSDGRVSSRRVGHYAFVPLR
jgi:protein-L-isoaspartate(D-aspartate) O-methyltransferase